MEKTGKTRSGVPYQYKMNNKKRAITNGEGLESDEEEVEDVQAMRRLRNYYMKHMKGKNGGPRSWIEGITPIHITISMEPTNPCETSTPERTPTFRQLNFSGIRTT
jgi:hypothetical protein